jgi:hypothetical protein
LWFFVVNIVFFFLVVKVCDASAVEPHGVRLAVHRASLLFSSLRRTACASTAPFRRCFAVETHAVRLYSAISPLFRR